MKKKTEYVIGFVVLAAILAAGRAELGNMMLFFRLVIGLGFGYALTRAFMGFAGSVNRSCRSGSARLMKTLMLLFWGTAAVNVCFLLGQDTAQFRLSVNPINLGLVLGGLLFGMGMCFSSCCATGVLTDMFLGLPRALITLVFFGAGIFLGFPVQNKATWITTTLVSTKTFPRGVFLPDFFKWDGLEGYLGALVLLAVFAGTVIWLAQKYEDKRKAENTYVPIKSETLQEKVAKGEITYSSVYEKLFVKPWTLTQGAVAIGGLFVILMGVTKGGWGASTPYGLWFGRALTLFGASPESVAAFSGKAAEMFTAPFFQNAMNLQNFGIILGALTGLLTMGIFTDTFKAGLSINFRQALIYMAGGLCMGFGTRLSNGCNVGALYTPIAHFSLSGWIYLIFLVLGGIGGNIIYKKLLQKK